MNDIELPERLEFVRKLGSGGHDIEDAVGMEQYSCREQKNGKKFNVTGICALSDDLLNVCAYSEKPVVLMIDEIDSAANNQVFLDFLVQLRSYYIKRESKGTNVFQSVIKEMNIMNAARSSLPVI